MVRSEYTRDLCESTITKHDLVIGTVVLDRTCVTLHFTLVQDDPTGCVTSILVHEVDRQRSPTVGIYHESQLLIMAPRLQTVNHRIYTTKGKYYLVFPAPECARAL